MTFSLIIDGQRAEQIRLLQAPRVSQRRRRQRPPGVPLMKLRRRRDLKNKLARLYLTIIFQASLNIASKAPEPYQMLD